MKITRIRDAIAPIPSADAQRRHLLRQDDDQRRRDRDRRHARGQARDRLRLLLQRALCAIRHHPRAPGAAHPGGRPQIAHRRGQRQSRPLRHLARHDEQREARRPRRARVRRGRYRHGRVGHRRPRSRASRCGACCRSASTAANSTSAYSSTPGGGYYYPGKEREGLQDEMRRLRDLGYRLREDEGRRRAAR